MFSSFKKTTIIFIAFLIVAMCTVSTAYASTKTVKAQDGVVIMYNGQKLTDSNQPYLINNTTYIPLRMLTNYFNDKSVQWNAPNKQVIVTDKISVTEARMNQQIQRLVQENSSLRNKISTLEQQIENEADDGSLSDIEDELEDYFEDAGDDYFNDEGIEVSISLDGDEDDITYEITLDFDDADEYDDLTEISENDIEDFLDDVESEISDEVEDTDYEDADITGEAVDDDDSDYYVEYDGRSYKYSWDDDVSLNDIEDELEDYFEDAGDDYFDDDGIEVSISLDGDEDDITYEITLDFDDADDYDDLTEISENDIEDFLDDIESEIYDEIEDTDYEDADITGEAVDDDDSDYYVEYDGRDYTYSWDD